MVTLGRRVDVLYSQLPIIHPAFYCLKDQILPEDTHITNSCFPINRQYAIVSRYNNAYRNVIREKPRWLYGNES